MAAGILGGLGVAFSLLDRLGGVGAVADKVGAIVDKFVPDPNQKAAAALELQKLVHDEKMQAAQAGAELAQQQLASATALNMESVKSGSQWGRWRDFIGWTIAIGVLYGIVIQPTGEWLMTFVSAWTDINFPPPPQLQWSQVLTILGVLLTGAGLSVASKGGTPK